MHYDCWHTTFATYGITVISRKYIFSAVIANMEQHHSELLPIIDELSVFD